VAAAEAQVQGDDVIDGARSCTFPTPDATPYDAAFGTDVRPLDTIDVVGRVVWKGSTGSLGAPADPVTPWVALLVALPVTLGVAALLAWWPARRSANVALAASLRTE